jgi:DNA-3-methyladenine glycosylase
MERRINRRINPVKDGSGPGKVTKLMGLDCSYNATDMTVSNVLWIEDSDFRFSRRLIKSTPRIGVEYAGEDALLPYRYLIDNQMAEAEIKKAGLC